MDYQTKRKINEIGFNLCFLLIAVSLALTVFLIIFDK